MKQKLTNLILKKPEFLTIAIIALYFICMGIINPRFIAVDTVVRILYNGTMLILITAGVSAVIITKNIDVSVGSLLGLSATFGATYLNTSHPSLAIFIMLTLGSGLLGGLFNGVGVAYGGVPSIIMTLGTLALFRGLLALYTGGSWIDTVPEWFLNFSRVPVMGLYYPTWITFIILAVLVLFFTRFKWGRYIYATGNSLDGAILQGIPVKKTVLFGFGVSGVMTGTAALIFISQIGTIPTQAGFGMETKAIAAAVIGGISLMGGTGSITGAALGALLLETISYSLVFFRVPGFWNNFISGFLLLVIVVATSRIQIYLRSEKEREIDERVRKRYLQLAEQTR
jgi:AI-2 transport system permease protein